MVTTVVDALKKYYPEFSFQTLINNMAERGAAKEEFDKVIHDWDEHIEPMACPFCGGLAEVETIQCFDVLNSYYHRVRVRCTECGTSGKSYISGGRCGSDATERDAILAWNHRV